MLWLWTWEGTWKKPPLLHNLAWSQLWKWICKCIEEKYKTILWSEKKSHITIPINGCGTGGPKILNNLLEIPHWASNTWKLRISSPWHWDCTTKVCHLAYSVLTPMLSGLKLLLGFINGYDWENSCMTVLPDGRPRPSHCCFSAILVNTTKSLPACPHTVLLSLTPPHWLSTRGFYCKQYASPHSLPFLVLYDTIKLWCILVF